MKKEAGNKPLIWPDELHLVRHGESEYNILKALKAVDPMYQEFKAEYEKWDRRMKASKNWLDELPHKKLIDLARQVNGKYSLGCSDPDTKLTAYGVWQAQQTGKTLVDIIEPPDVVFCSPYERTKQTFENVAMFCPQLKTAKFYEEDRIRELEHGLATVYNDWRVFHVFHPEQKVLFDITGSYDYCFPNGENIARGRDRIRRWFDKLVREFAGKKVWAFSHHLTILTIVGLYDHWDRDTFIEWDKNRVPPNLSVTTFCSTNTGKPKLTEYGKVHYDSSLYVPAQVAG